MQTLTFLAGAVAALAGAGLAGAFSLIRQRRDAADRTTEERRIDLRNAIDVGADALAKANYQVFLADIRAHVYIDSGDAEPYLRIDSDVNEAILAVKAAGIRLAIRVPDEATLLASFQDANDALVRHRDLVGAAAQSKRPSSAVVSSREDVESRIHDFQRAAGDLLRIAEGTSVSLGTAPGSV